MHKWLIVESGDILKKPHITIYKDLTTVESNFDFTENKEIKSLENIIV